jgi:hypothetical protein
MLLREKHKNSLMLLIFLVMMSWSSFSQDVTENQIQLTKPVAKLVIKDLIQFDGLSKEMQTMQTILTETNNKLLTQGTLVANLKTQVENYQTIIDKKDSQMVKASELSKDLQKELKKQARQKKLYKIGSTVGAVALALLLVK